MMMAAPAASGFADVISSKFSWFILLDVAEILIVTILLILQDLSDKNRPFDWLPILFTIPFGWLMLIQSAIVAVALVVLVGLRRATFGGIDAWWVALAGLSILKSLPGGSQGQSGAKLTGLADWLFKKFYGDLRLEIQKRSRSFVLSLTIAYKNAAAAFLQDAMDFIDASEAVPDAAKDKKTVTTEFAAQTSDTLRVQYLANWIGPRTTRKKWARLTGK